MKLKLGFEFLDLYFVGLGLDLLYGGSNCIMDCMGVWNSCFWFGILI